MHEKMSGTKVYPNDILLNITGGSLGRSTIFYAEVGEANVSQHVTIIRPAISQTRFFLHLCIISPYGQELIWGRQVGANREGLSKRILELFEFPIPPLKEQQRIVSKVTELFALCDGLKARLAAAQSLAGQMAEGVVAEA
jgi:type I restriction enzyme S subunit